MTFICAQLHCFDLYRLQIIQEQIKNGENEAFLVSFPDFFRDYVWLSDPPHENGINAFKHFYHLKEDISLTIISYDEYLKLKK